LCAAACSTATMCTRRQFTRSSSARHSRSAHSRIEIRSASAFATAAAISARGTRSERSGRSTRISRLFGSRRWTSASRLRKPNGTSRSSSSRRSHSPTDIYGLIIRQGMTLALVGVLLGAGGAVLTSRALTTMLFGVSALDDVTYVGVIAVLLGIAAIACWLPASRAARVDPSVTLRAE
jgi:hypothetical protein